MDLKWLESFYRDRLVNDLLPFWVKFATDKECGGYHTNLNRDGSVYDYNKTCMWAQGRVAWVMAHMYNEFERCPEWLETSRVGVEFLLKNSFTPDGRIYYAMTRDGKPMEAPQCIFAELSAVLAFAEYARATGDEKLYQRARALFELCWSHTRNADSIERNEGLLPETLRIRRHGHSMIVLNVIQQLRLFREASNDAARVDECIGYMLGHHQKPARRLVLEVVSWDDGAVVPGWKGRSVNPGHMIEGGIFLVHESRFRGDNNLREAGLNWIRWGFELGWDSEYGGIFNNIDSDNMPVPDASAACLADSKLWWQHAEALYGLLLAYVETSDEWFLNAFRKTHDYSFEHFADPEHGEWFAFLDRSGRPVNFAKGTSRKNCFHIVRNFLWICKLLEKRTEAE